MNNYKIQLELQAPDKQIAQTVANEAQRLLDQYGYDQFLNLVSFMRNNPTLVNIGINLINQKR